LKALLMRKMPSNNSTVSSLMVDTLMSAKIDLQELLLGPPTVAEEDSDSVVVDMEADMDSEVDMVDVVVSVEEDTDEVDTVVVDTAAVDMAVDTEDLRMVGTMADMEVEVEAANMLLSHLMNSLILPGRAAIPLLPSLSPMYVDPQEYTKYSYHGQRAIKISSNYSRR